MSRYKVLVDRVTVDRAEVEVEVPVDAPVGISQEDWKEMKLEEKLEWLAPEEAHEKSVWHTRSDEVTLISYQKL